jgi:hypothetical protein
VQVFKFLKGNDLVFEDLRTLRNQRGSSLSSLFFEAPMAGPVVLARNSPFEGGNEFGLPEEKGDVLLSQTGF